MQPLADRIRPKNLNEYIGQKHIIGKDSALLNAIKQNLSVYDDWSEISDNLDNNNNSVINENWQYWSASSSWATVLDEQSQEVSLLSLDAKEIFNTYSGLSSGVVNDNSIVNVSHDSVVVINDVTWDVFLI